MKLVRGRRAPTRTRAKRARATPAPAAAAAPAPPRPGETRILRVGEVIARVGLGRTTLWKLVRRREFPSPVQLSANAIGWRDADVEQWINTRAPLRVAR